MGNIEVRRTIHIEAPDPSQRVWVADIAYASKDRDVLVEGVSVGNRAFIRRSEDNGKTWREVEQWKQEEPLGENLVLVRGLPVVFADPDNGFVLRVFYTCLNKPGVLPWDYALSPMVRTYKAFSQVSKDEGLTWSEPEQIILQGGDYDQVHWMDGVWHGKNGAVIDGGHITSNRNGSVLAPYYGARLFGDDIINREIELVTSNPDGNIEWVSGCLIGCWKSDGSGIVWSQSSPITLPRKYSCDGGDEGSFDYLPDGRLFMVLRARTYTHTGQELPSLHYYVLSSDEGRTWSEPEPLIYDDGSYAFSPSCLANVFRSSKNGRFYVITNFADGPCVNCDPRNKLQIAEIETNTQRIKKDTVAVVEQQDKEAGQPDTIRFSNFRWYEDRKTGDIVLYMTTCPGDNPPPGFEFEMLPHSYRYDIRIPA